jgi:dihydroneopterin aldolase
MPPQIAAASSFSGASALAKRLLRATAKAVDPTSAGGDQIRVEQLEIFARVGVTENEISKPQRLTVTITVWLNEPFEKLEDDITRTVNYSVIAVAAREFADEHPCKLVETLAAQMAAHLLRTFAVARVRIELHKFVLPDAEHVAVVLTRAASGK